MIQIQRVRRPTILLSLLGLSAAVAIGYFVVSAIATLHKPDRTADDGATRPPVAVRIAFAELRTLTPVLEVIGNVQPDPERYSVLAAATTGLVARLAAREGAWVAQNDVVFELDERPARLALDRAEAAYARLIAQPRPEELAQARLLVEKTAAAHALAESRLEKTRDLRARNPELVPDIELLDERRNEQVTRAEWEIAQAQMSLLERGPRLEVRRESQVEVAAAQLQLEFCQVRAPIAGEVVQIMAFVGQRADVGTPLATILDASEVLVQGRIPGDRLRGMLPVMQAADQGTLAVVCCSSFADERFPARGGWLSEQTEAQTGDVSFKLRVPNPKGLLRVGMTVRVELHEQPVEGVAIPDVAVTVNEEGRRVVTVVRDGKAVPTEITIASEQEPEVRAGGWIRVLFGLQPGEAVAVENGYALPNGTPVDVLPSAPKTAALRP